HKLSRKLVQEYNIICLEDINMKNMSRCLRLGKATMDNGFGMFRTMLSYKAEDLGKHIVFIDKWYPSSKTCHYCGTVEPSLTLKDRDWTCPSCGKHLDRDVNAAINIKKEGLRLLSC
ncbi:MAG: RNA-guided endonuclease TnpB family protein, partial [Oscillospiraceae bacterium]